MFVLVIKFPSYSVHVLNWVNWTWYDSNTHYQFLQVEKFHVNSVVGYLLLQQIVMVGCSMFLTEWANCHEFVSYRRRICTFYWITSNANAFNAKGLVLFFSCVLLCHNSVIMSIFKIYLLWRIKPGVLVAVPLRLTDICKWAIFWLVILCLIHKAHYNF